MKNRIGPENEWIGKRIRVLRKEKRFTLRTLAERADLSVPYLSQVENGRVNITIKLAKKICDALEKPVSALFEAEREGDAVIIRRRDQTWLDVDSSTRTAETLLVSDGSTFEVWRIYLESGGRTEPNQHAGEEFTHVLRGRVQVVLNEENVFSLEPGDVLYYQSDTPHHWQNPYEEDADILVVNSPATF